jgi:hypothetical protein
MDDLGHVGAGGDATAGRGMCKPVSAISGSIAGAAVALLRGDGIGAGNTGAGYSNVGAGDGGGADSCSVGPDTAAGAEYWRAWGAGDAGAKYGNVGPTAWAGAGDCGPPMAGCSAGAEY